MFMREEGIVNPQHMREGYSSLVCLSVCLSVPSTLEPAAIRTLQLQSQRCLRATIISGYNFTCFLCLASTKFSDLVMRSIECT